MTLIPVGVGFAVGMNPALLLGSLTGAMTSTPSLKLSEKPADVANILPGSGG